MGGSSVSRRKLLIGAGAAALSAVWARGEENRAGTAGCQLDPRVFEPQPQVAVSLKQVAAEAAGCGKRCAPFHPMGGLTRLDGYAVDRANNDIVLWGLSEDGVAPLMYDDFVVAVRAAAGKYAVREHGRLVHYAPGISIDADPAMWKRLDTEADLNTERGRARYSQICDTPMRLRVDGMPRNTRVADILLAADYRMKLVNQGKATIPIQNFFKGISERRYERRQMEILRGANYPEPDYDVNRYWFSAGAFDYQASPTGDTVFLKTAQIVLNQVAERSTGREMLAAGVVSPAEQSYVCDWNARMDDTYAAERIWREMYNVFRHFAVANILVDSDAIARAGFNARALLETHQVERVQVPDSLPGSSFVIRQKVGSREWFYSNCGGVTVDVGKAMTRVADGGEADQAGRMVLSGRQRGGLDWRV